MKKELESVYERLQHLEGVPPTKNNLETILDTLKVLEMVYAKMFEEVKIDVTEGEPECNTEA